jgi:Ca2+-transporting ATPase
MKTLYGEKRRAKRAIAGLSKLSEPTATVRRDGQDNEVPVEEIVPGDSILLRAGRRVPADARLIESYSLATNESSLTGESVPIDKDAHLLLSKHIVQAEQQNMIFAGTTITRGLGCALVVTTGMQTELGHIAGLAQDSQTLARRMVTCDCLGVCWDILDRGSQIASLAL